jgi:hypothetical protein
MGDVTTFPGIERPDQALARQPQPAIIAKLEELLESARLGEVQGIAVATILDDGSVGRCYDLGTNVLALNIHLAGSVALLQHFVLSDLRTMPATVAIP